MHIAIALYVHKVQPIATIKIINLAELNRIYQLAIWLAMYYVDSLPTLFYSQSIATHQYYAKALSTALSLCQ